MIYELNTVIENGFWTVKLNHFSRSYALALKHCFHRRTEGIFPEVSLPGLQQFTMVTCINRMLWRWTVIQFVSTIYSVYSIICILFEPVRTLKAFPLVAHWSGKWNFSALLLPEREREFPLKMLLFSAFAHSIDNNLITKTK